MFVKVDHDGRQHHVLIVGDDGETEADGTYESAAAAEARAEVLAKLLGCDWGSN